jgi:cyclic pyranopterin phosphate synthase
MKKPKLSHYSQSGAASMVDVSAKPLSSRAAVARAYVAMPPEVVAALPHNKKGDPLEVARIAGISAAKKTSDLIPLCHPLPLTHIAVEFRCEPAGIEITASARTVAQTGVEMEAMTAAAVAALTIYDMTKASNKAIEIRSIHLLEKTGGKSGTFRRKLAK